MKGTVGVGALGLLLSFQAGCIAVSAKEVHSGMRYEAVASRDGKLYVVDKDNRTAREVRILADAELPDP